MSYFSIFYHHLKYPISQKNSHGLRNAQLGAMHAIGSYFTLNRESPAIVVMPTGSGKTAVLISSAFLLRAKRVLVITPSVLVRGQIFDEFNELRTLKKINAFLKDIDNPKVHEQKTKFEDISDCQIFENYDVIVSTPNSFNSILDDIDSLNEIFDLLIIDEAHHSPAKTWNKLLNAFSNTKKILFTATPFRRDKKEILGEIIYNYPLSLAYNDEIFGDIKYIPVIPDSNSKLNDYLIAKKTEEIYIEDEKKGYNHAVIIRTSTKKHAKELKELYSQKTKLKVRVIDSTKTNTYIKQTISKLEKQELHGIVCVDMLGEGFDFPRLKIGAIHSPHRSLAITLQFIGRFARTNTDRIGTAKFIAVSNEELEIEKFKLFSEESIWKDIIIELSENRIHKEGEEKKDFKSFHRIPTNNVTSEPISLYSLAPYSHVKIFHVNSIELEANIALKGHEVVFHEVSQELSVIVLVTKMPSKPKWIKNDSIVDYKHSLLIIYFNKDQRLLYINSTERSDEIYNEIKDIISQEEPKKLPTNKIRKVLINLKETEFFNIGMASRYSNSGETYRIISGSNAEKTIRKTDGRLYSGGHVFAKGQNTKDENITIGYSTNSKVWCNSYNKIPDLIKWCDMNGDKILSNLTVQTNSGYDILAVGEVIGAFPSKIYAAAWNGDTYKDTPFLKIENTSEENLQLLDFEIIVQNHKKNTDYIDLILHHSKIQIHVVYYLANHFELVAGEPNKFKVNWGNHSLDLVNYLNEYSLTYYLQDFSSFYNHEWYRASSPDTVYYDESNIIPFDWNGVDIQNEDNGKRSIHNKIKSELIKKKNNIIIYDHGSGEIADFITINENKREIKLELFHIKASGGTKATSNRVNDIYEVCGQAVKSLVWIRSVGIFKKALERRTKGKEQKYIQGKFEEVIDILDKQKILSTQITIIQPGITKSTLPMKMEEILSATTDYIDRNTPNPLKVIGSI